MMFVAMEDPGLIVLPTHRLFRGLPAMTSRGAGGQAGRLLHRRGRPARAPTRPPTVWEDIETGGNQGTLGLFTQKDQQWTLARADRRRPGPHGRGGRGPQPTSGRRWASASCTGC